MSPTVETRVKQIALAGNPNCGKTVIFNGLTGGNAKVGNWPGVTVERLQGKMKFGHNEVDIIDLPGIYSLSAESEDERIARDFLVSGNADLVVCILDAANLERNMYLATSIIESGVPVVLALNMMDAAKKAGIQIKTEVLSQELGCPVLPVTAIENKSFSVFKKELCDYVQSMDAKKTSSPVSYKVTLEGVMNNWSAKLSEAAAELGVSPRFLAIGVLEEDPYITDLVKDNIGEDEISSAIKELEKEYNSTLDMVIADSRYSWITSVLNKSVTQKPEKAIKNTADKILMHRFLGIPIFVGVMYLVFWLTMTVGGAFIDFFDILFGGIFVDGFGTLLQSIGSPQWLTAILAGGVGGGIQTVSTFVPIIFMMFLMLSILEDSGYMARAAFVMDKAMMAIGLPGKAFVPMLVGFGCTVPAIMATRTLETKRDRFMAIFMTPFMSCGARLPVYAIFAAVFFGGMAGSIVFTIYLTGIVLAILTGLLLKNTMFKGKSAPFVMELPAYHMPRVGAILGSAWRRLRAYLFRAGKVIVLVVLVLSVLNSWGTDGSFGNEDSEESVLSVIGKSITPVFTPMGIESENWPATVSLFTGLFAKEVVVGTLNSLYLQEEEIEEDTAAEPAEEASWDLFAIIGESVSSIWVNLAGAFDGLLDPLGVGIVTADEAALGEELETGEGVFASLRQNFTPISAYAFMLFILVYFPCVAALGVAVQETGKAYGALLVTYLTVLAWIIATLFFQILEGGSLLWIIIPLVLLAGIIATFAYIGKKTKKIEQPW
ncbi:MAG: Fe(2+) transporter permease subunit FeoB [Spirochaetia bacterium]